MRGPNRTQLRPEPEEDETRAVLPDGAFLDRAADALFAARTVLVYGEVNTRLARTVTAQLLALAAAGSGPIRVIVHSPGGHVEAGDTIHDVVRAIGPRVVMIGTGWVASAGALIYSAAEKENRYALPNTRFLLHQPLGGMGGRASDIEIEAHQILQMRERLNRIFARATGQDYERIVRDTERNFWMSANEAREYGLVHRIVDSLAEVKT
ncbi:MAG: ATP-dependent Clp protease proteolytic subunit [Deltaproteobacteria bacterium]|nr:ATP-dependent Clp protease proteolytic subunit [Deltaproteobacteria bacterium]